MPADVPHWIADTEAAGGLNMEKNAVVYLKSGIHTDKSIVGRVVSPGPVQSIVKWPNGNETCVLNAWVEPIDGGEGPGQSPLAAVQTSSPSEAKAKLPEQAPVDKPKRAAPDDDIVERLKALTPEQVKEFALRNGVWDDKYDALSNPGLRRMNVVNRARAKTRRGEALVWS